MLAINHGKTRGAEVNLVASKKPPVYRVYLLTVWQEHSQEEMPDHSWRFHLTDPQTGKRYGFTSAVTRLARLQHAASRDAPTGAGSDFRVLPLRCAN